jgi:hypothetical protein
MRSNPQPMACDPDEHAVEMVIFGPFNPKKIAISAAGAFDMVEGTDHG